MILRWCNKPGSFYTTVCPAFVGLQTLNLIGYLQARELSELRIRRPSKPAHVLLGRLDWLPESLQVDHLCWSAIACVGEAHRVVLISSMSP